MVGQFTEGRRWHDLAVAVNPGSRENAWAVFGAGVLAVQQGDLDAGAPLLDRAAALAAASGDENLAAHVSDALGIVAFNGGDLETAQARYEAALASYERIGFGDPLALVTYSRLASACILSGALDRAVQLCEECLRRCDETGEQWARGTALWVRGATRWLSGDITAAIADSLSCLRIKESVNDLHTIAMSFDLLSVCRVATAEFELAAVLHGAGEALWTLLNAPVLMGPGYAEIRKGAADTARAALGEERFDELLSRGLAMHLADALAMAKGETPADGVLGGESGGSAAKQLTRREKEIAALVAAGLGNREIAARLFLSKRTVDSHMEHIFTKLGFSSRTQLASWVLGQGKQPVAGPFPVTITPRCPAFILRHQYSSRTSAATFPPVTGRLPAGGKVSRMSDDAEPGLSRRQLLAAGTTGLIATAAVPPAAGAGRRRSGAADGTPEQIHLTWGDDPARSVVVSWASPGRALAPRVRIGQRVIPAVERGYADPRDGEVAWTYHAPVDGLRPGATYGYAVTADNDRNAADPFSATFRTAPEGRAAFRFTSFGDLTAPSAPGRARSSQSAYAVGAVETFQPLFHLLNGDLADADPNPPADRGAGLRQQPPGLGREPALAAGAGRSRGRARRAGAGPRVLPGPVLAARQRSARVRGAVVRLPGRHRRLPLPQRRRRAARLLGRRADPLARGGPRRRPAGRLDRLGRDPAPPVRLPVRARRPRPATRRRRPRPQAAVAAAVRPVRGRPGAVRARPRVRALVSRPRLRLRRHAAPAPGDHRRQRGVRYQPGHRLPGARRRGRRERGRRRGRRGGASGAAWSARRDTATGYGVAVFDVNPGAEAGAQTSITVSYYHAVDADLRGPGADPGDGGPADDYALFDTFTLVRPRSDGRRWHPREPAASNLA